MSENLRAPCALASPQRSLCILAAAAGVALAGAEPVPGTLRLGLEPVASSLTAPLAVRAPDDGSGRIFIVTQVGKIWIVRNGVLNPTPFIDIGSRLPTLNAGFDERGLLGLAFHPDFASNGRFFLRHSAPRTGVAGEPCFGTSRGCHEEVLAEYSVSDSDPNVANPVGTILFRVDEPQFNHNGGDVHFGPDGYLYFSLGDGGGAHDGLADNPPSHGPIGNGQNLQTSLGKIIRIDVDAAPPYEIPPTNPFFGDPDALDEIYAFGLRNPFRFCFDDGAGGDGKLICADVGQAQYEEINIVQSGGNYGWVVREGLHCFDPFAPNVPPPTCASTGARGEPLRDPIAEYSHATGISITGGFVYRGSRFPELAGKYVFGDWSRTFGAPGGQIFYLDPAQNPATIYSFRSAAPLGRFVLGFGRDASGEIYVCTTQSTGPTGTSGAVFRIAIVCRGDINEDNAINLTDLATLLTNFGSPAGATFAQGDIDGDGDVDLSDLAILLTSFGTNC